MAHCIDSNETNLQWHDGQVEGVWLGEARKDGPIIGVIGGVHGDEKAGVEIVNRLQHTLQLTGGYVVLIMANLEAVKDGLRQTEDGENLNRAFKPVTLDDKLRNPLEMTYERRRAIELMDYLLQCTDGFIDLHQYEQADATSKPHIICERDAKATALKVGAPLIAHGFSQAEAGGTDGFGYENGIEAMCYELGPMPAPYHASSVHYGGRVLDRYFYAKGLSDRSMPPLYPAEETMFIEVQPDAAYKRIGALFKLAREFTSFEALTPGELVATDDGHEVRADPTKPQLMMWPKPDPAIGREAFSLADVLPA